MAEIDLTVVGLDRIVSQLQAANDGITGRVQAGMKTTTDRGVEIAKSEAPVDTGKLKSEIYGVPTALSGLVRSPTSYAGFVDGGTSRQPPNNYMGRTKNRLEPVLTESMIDAIWP